MSDDERISIALAALAEVTDAEAIGPLVDASVPVPGVIDLRFATTRPGYAGWFWTVSTSAVDGVEPTVLELELLPGDGALIAPAWTPWEERLADWRRAHPGDAVDGEDDEDDDEDLDDDGGLDDEDDDPELDETDLDDEPIDDVLDDEDLDGEPADGEPAEEDPDGPEDADDEPEPERRAAVDPHDPYGYLETVGSTPPRKR